MKKIVALLVCIFCASVCWGQYKVAYTTGVTDATTYCTTAGNTCWKVLPSAGHCLPGTLTQGHYGVAYCVGTDHYAYKFDGVNNHAWSKMTALGPNLMVLAANDEDNIWSLQNNGVCTSQQYGIFKWTGTAWTQPDPIACVSTLSIASDGTLAAQRNMGTGYIFRSFDSGVSWPAVSQVGGWTYIMSSSATDFCAVQNGVLFTQLSRQTAPVAFSPSPGTITGCTMNMHAPDTAALVVWNATTVKSFDTTTGAWSTIPGLVASQVALFGKSSILGIDPTNQIFHWNVYAGTITATLSGSWGGCPVPQIPCQGAVYHDGSVRIYLPHGKAGVLGYQHALNYVNMNVNSMDWSPTCDPLDSSDQECIAAIYEDLECEATGAHFTGTPGAPTPQQPPPIGGHFSEYVGSFNGDTPTTNWTRQLGPEFWAASVSCHAWLNTCEAGTDAICKPPLISGNVKTGGVDEGPGATAQTAIDAARGECARHSIVIRSPGAWGIFSNYITVNGVNTCTALVPYDAIPYLTPCF